MESVCRFTRPDVIPNQRKERQKMGYTIIEVPEGGAKITKPGDKLIVPDNPIIPFIEGDGTGRDIWRAASRVFDAAVEKAYKGKRKIYWMEVYAGEKAYHKFGEWLPEETIKAFREFIVGIKGPLTTPIGGGIRSLNVAIRKALDLYVCQRPVRYFPGVPSPLKHPEWVDMVIFRENTEDLYCGVEFFPVPDELNSMLKDLHPKYARFAEIPADEKAISLRINTLAASERIIRAGFDYAKKHGRKSLTIVEKPNVVRETSGIMVRTARKVAGDYPDVELWEANIDAMAMWLVKNPQDYDVLVASNLFGDIISDLAAQLVGGLGFSPSGNIGKDYGLFEPTHGSAPKYAGMNKVNPTAAILAAKMMLDYLGETKLAAQIEYGVAQTIREGEVRTYDMGGTSSTSDVACRVARWAREG
jgi:isocitrate dehydrogenase